MWPVGVTLVFRLAIVSGSERFGESARFQLLDEPSPVDLLHLKLVHVRNDPDLSRCGWRLPDVNTKLTPLQYRWVANRLATLDSFEDCSFGFGVFRLPGTVAHLQLVSIGVWVSIKPNVYTGSRVVLFRDRQTYSILTRGAKRYRGVAFNQLHLSG